MGTMHSPLILVHTVQPAGGTSQTNAVQFEFPYRRFHQYSQPTLDRTHLFALKYPDMRGIWISKTVQCSTCGTVVHWCLQQFSLDCKGTGLLDQGRGGGGG